MTIIGTDTAGSINYTGNFILYCKYIALSDGLVSTLNIYSAVAGNCKAAIYADSSGLPSEALGINNDGVAFEAGMWNNISLDRSVEIVGGEYYWLSFITDRTGVSVRTANPGVSLYTPKLYSTGMPDPAGSGLNIPFDGSVRAYNFGYGVNAIQAGDVLMLHVDDRGEIEDKNGFITMTGSFETMVYLTLFGGNEDDNNSESTELKQWWGNEGEPLERQYRSRFQHECSSGRPVTSASITVIIEAAENDLKDAFVTTGYAKSVEISEVEIVNPKRIRIAGFITLDEGNTEPFDLEGNIS